MGRLLKKLIIIDLIILFLGLTILQIHNAHTYPIQKGFDAIDHVYYINIIKQQHRLPLANEGSETDHPPLYFVTASLFPTIDQSKLIGFIAWLSLVVTVFITMRNLLHDTRLAGTAAVIVSTLPVVLYSTPQISNELFSAAVMTMALGYYVLHRDLKTKTQSIILGLLLGLALLSKVTAVVLVFCIVLDIIMNRSDKGTKIISPVGMLLLTTLVIGSGFYLRNLLIFGNPFIMSTDFAHQVIHQPPGYRDLRFFTDLIGFIKLDVFHAHYYSLWAGTYFSWFYDGHNAVVPVQAFSKAGAAIALLGLPLCVLAVAGLRIELKKRKHLIFLLYPSVLFIFYLYFTVKFPFYSSVKGLYLLSAILPFVYFIMKGVEASRKMYIPFLLFLNIYTLIILRHFWIT